MPNRIIKESICRSGSIDSLSWFEEVLFYRLMVVCDDYGRFDGRPAIIRGACFPLKDMRLEQIEDALKRLAIAGMIRRYETEDGAFLQLTAWGKHQQIRAKHSKYPAPEEACHHLPTNNNKDYHEIEHDINGNQLISDDCNCPRNRESGIENRETNTMCKADALALFEELWKLYPSKKGKGQVSLAAKQRLLKVGHEEMVRAIDRYKSDLEMDREWRKPQNGSTFFNTGYIDYLDSNYGSTQTIDGDDSQKPQPEEFPPQKAEPQPGKEDLVGDEEEWWRYGPNAWED